jgi:hypothetical protein
MTRRRVHRFFVSFNRGCGRVRRRNVRRKRRRLRRGSRWWLVLRVGFGLRYRGTRMARAFVGAVVAVLDRASEFAPVAGNLKANLEHQVVVEGTGVRLFIVHTEFRQKLKNYTWLYFQLARQLIYPNLTHTVWSPRSLKRAAGHNSTRSL